MGAYDIFRQYLFKVFLKIWISSYQQYSKDDVVTIHLNQQIILVHQSREILTGGVVKATNATKPKLQARFFSIPFSLHIFCKFLDTWLLVCTTLHIFCKILDTWQLLVSPRDGCPRGGWMQLPGCQPPHLEQMKMVGAGQAAHKQGERRRTSGSLVWRIEVDIVRATRWRIWKQRMEPVFKYNQKRISCHDSDPFLSVARFSSSFYCCHKLFMVRFICNENVSSGPGWPWLQYIVGIFQGGFFLLKLCHFLSNLMADYEHFLQFWTLHLGLVTNTTSKYRLLWGFPSHGIVIGMHWTNFS